MTTPRTEAGRRYLDTMKPHHVAVEGRRSEREVMADWIAAIEAEAAAPDVEALDVERLRRAIDATRDRSVSLDPITIAAEYARLLKGSGDPR